jgi:hypothetical protein
MRNAGARRGLAMAGRAGDKRRDMAFDPCWK